MPLPLDGSTAVLEVTVDSRGLSVISPGMARYVSRLMSVIYLLKNFRPFLKMLKKTHKKSEI